MDSSVTHAPVQSNTLADGDIRGAAGGAPEIDHLKSRHLVNLITILTSGLVTNHQYAGSSNVSALR